MKARLTVRAGIAGKIGARGWYQNKTNSAINKHGR